MGTVRRTSALVLAALGCIAACGGNDAPIAAPDIATPTTVPTGSTNPDELAFQELAVEVAHLDQVALTPGEEASFAALAYNASSSTITLRLAATAGDERFEVDLGVTQLRLKPEESVAFDITVTAAGETSVGTRAGLELTVTLVSDRTRRTTSVGELVVVQAGGLRPDAVDDITRTTTSETVTTFVLSNDVDVDGDLDYGTFTVVGGGFRAAEVFAGAGGAIVYRPFLGQEGIDRVLYRLCDKSGRCDTGVLTLDINPGQPPIPAGN